MSDTSETTYISELMVPLSVIMLSDSYEPNTLNTYGDVYAMAEYYNVIMSDVDREFWNRYSSRNIDSSDKKEVFYRSVLAGRHIFYDFYQGTLSNCDVELIGRGNDNFPPDFRIGSDLFSLKDNSNILWNTTPKALFPYIKSEIAEALQNENMQYLQGKTLYTSDGKLKVKQPAYDWFLYADHDLCQYNYRNLLWSVFQLFYDIKMWKQPYWNPNCGEGDWWKTDENYGDVLPLTADSKIRGDTEIPLNTPERLIFSDKFGGHYEVYLYDGFDEDSYPVTFLGLRNTKNTLSIGIIPIIFYDEDMYAYPYFDGSCGLGSIDVEDVLNRSDYVIDAEYIPFYNFTVNKAGNRRPMTSDTAKVISRFISKSAYSPANSIREYASFYEPNVPSSIPHPISEYDSIQIEIPSNMEMTAIEYWLTRLKIAASDSLAFCVEDILEIDATQFIAMLARIYDTPYYYVRMFDDGPAIYRVPSKEEFCNVSILDIDFDSDQKNTMMVIRCGNEESIVDLRIEFRNKGGIFAGAPDMVVLYDDTSDLNGIYQRII